MESLRDAGAQVEPFLSTRNPMRRLQLNFRNHRKIVVVDGRLAYVGGHNVGDEYLGCVPELSPWRDTHIEVRGPAASAVQLAFIEDWNWVAGEIPDLHWRAEAVEPRDLPVLVVPSGPADEFDTCSLFFTHVIDSAQRRLWISSPYFVPDEPVVAALQLAVMRGVDVRILLPGGRIIGRSISPAFRLSKICAARACACFASRKAFCTRRSRCATTSPSSEPRTSTTVRSGSTSRSACWWPTRSSPATWPACWRSISRTAREIDAARLAAISLPTRVASRAARLFAPVL